MFDKTFTLSSTDESVSVEITAGTEGVRSILLHAAGQSKSVTTQQLIDMLAPAVKEALSGSPNLTSPSSSSAS